MYNTVHTQGAEEARWLLLLFGWTDVLSRLCHVPIRD